VPEGAVTGNRRGAVTGNRTVRTLTTANTKEIQKNKLGKKKENLNELAG